jgi:hypothetical protein
MIAECQALGFVGRSKRAAVKDGKETRKEVEFEFNLECKSWGHSSWAPLSENTKFSKFYNFFDFL